MGLPVVLPVPGNPLRAFMPGAGKRLTVPDLVPERILEFLAEPEVKVPVILAGKTFKVLNIIIKKVAILLVHLHTFRDWSVMMFPDRPVQPLPIPRCEIDTIRPPR
jgi:hypothetical protein